MTAAAPEDLALTLEHHITDLQETTAALILLTSALKAGDLNAADHAEERISWAVDGLRGTTLRLEYLKRYTVTGARRG